MSIEDRARELLARYEHQSAELRDQFIRDVAALQGSSGGEVTQYCEDCINPACTDSDCLGPPSAEAAKVGEDEKSLFERHYKHLDLTREIGAWGHGQYKHSHVAALWEGWNNRAALTRTSNGEGREG